jgi:hypothetical protein
MVQYLQASTNIVRLPKKMIFVDKKGNQHLFPSLTPSHHIASHYGQLALGPAYNKRLKDGITLEQGQYTTYKNKVKKQQKAVKELVKANVAVETAAKKMRGRPRKNATIAAAAPVMAVIPTAPKKTRTRLTPEQKALKAQQKADKKALQAQKKADKEQMKANKAQIKADKALAKELAKAKKAPKKKAKMD